MRQIIRILGLSLILLYLFSPLFVSAQTEHLLISKSASESILNAVQNEVTSKGVPNLLSFTSREQAAIFLFRSGARRELLSFIPEFAATETIKIVIKSASFLHSIPQATTKDLIEMIEDKSVKEASKYAMSWLFQNQIRTSSGNLEYSYTSYKGETKKASFQYVILYRKTRDDLGEVILKFYSSEPIDPPETKGSLGCLTKTPWDLSGWLKKGNKKLDPFILRIKTEVKKELFGYKVPPSAPTKIKVSFPQKVPHLKLSKELPYFLEEEKTKLQNYLVLIQKFFGNTKETGHHTFQKTKGFLGKLKTGIGQIAEGLKSGLSGIDLWGAEVSKPIELISIEQLKQKTSQRQKEMDQLKERIKKLGERIDESSPKPSQPSPDQIEKLASKIDKLSGEIERMQNKIKESKKDQKETKEQKQEKEKKEEKRKQETPEQKTKILISEVCAGLDKAQNEFIELYNPATTSVSLSKDNFNLKLIDSSNNPTNKQIDWSNSTIPAQGYFLLTGGKLNIEGQPLSPDATFSSQLTGTSGVIISDGNKNTLDKVGWGKLEKRPPLSAVETQGVISKGGLNTGESLQRKSQKDSLIDTNNNSQDFILSNQPSPTNSSGKTKIYKSPSSENNDSQSSSEENGGEGFTGGGYSPPSEPASCSQTNLSSPSHSPIIVSEVAWMGTENDYREEWIELKNISENEVSLNNWQILDKQEQIKVVFDSNDTIPAGQFYLLERTDDNPVSQILADKIYTGSLANQDESLRLFDENCNLVDEVVADPDWPAGENDSKRTMERKADLKWQTSENIGGTPKAENSKGKESEPPAENQPPIAAFSYLPENPKIDQQITFDASSSTDPDGQITSFNWEFGDQHSATSTSATTTYSYSNAGTSTVALTIIDNHQATSSTSTTIQIEEQKEQPAKALITEILFDAEGSDKDQEFIELYNGSNSEINISNWSIQYLSPNASSVDKIKRKNFEENNKINPNHYFLIGLNGRAGDTTWSQALGNQGGTILLVNNQGPESDIVGPNDKNIIDQIGYGSGEGLILAEGSPFNWTSNFEEGKSIGRKWNSSSKQYQDTNNNSLDFEIQSPTPRSKNQTTTEPPPSFEIVIDHADTVWNLNLNPASSNVKDPTDAPLQDLPEAFVSHGDTSWNLDLVPQDNLLSSTDALPQNLLQACVSKGESVWRSNLEKQF